MADAFSIEETNKLRVSLGLKPLPVPGQDGPAFKAPGSPTSEDEGSTLESRQAQGYDNWKKLQEEAERRKKNQVRTDAIKKARDLAQKHAKIQGKGLADESDEEIDTRKWLVQQKKRQRKIEKQREKARKMEEELKERESVAYTSKDLAGVRVAHEVEDFDLGSGEQVLTLKDTTLDENEEEGDELENVQLREKEKTEDRLSLKKKKPIYNPNDIDESDESKVLAQYDEVIDGKKRKRFTLDADGSTVEEREAKKQALGDKLNAQSFSLDAIPDLPISDYQEPKEVSFKKPKKKKSKGTREKAVDDEDFDPSAKANVDAMEVDNDDTSVRQVDSSFIDDDDLQVSLAKQRREALKNRKKVKPEDIARQIRERSPGTIAADDVQENKTGELVINEATQFLANIQKPEERSTRKSPSAPISSMPQQPAVDGDSDSEEGPDNDIDMDRPIKDETEGRGTTPATAAELTATGLEDEASLSQGIGNTLSLLRQRGLIEDENPGDLNAQYRNRQRFLWEKQQREEAAELKARHQRERDRVSGKLDRMSAREREEYARWENKSRDQAESRQMAEIFNREYKPVVEIRHVDDHGRELNKKEAFKYMSHQFHGKGSGKKKTEKHLKKIDEEKQRNAQSVLDSGQRAGLNTALGATAKKTKQAGVRLA